MCGIIATVRPRGAGAAVIDGLRHLEYRGYDSAGLALGHADGPLVQRAVGPLKELLGLTGPTGWLATHPSQVAIGHTRWATHGQVSLANAHPLLDCTGAIALVHNGVIDNAVALRTELALAGHRFSSDVDSEVIAHLVEDALDEDVEPIDAVAKALARLEGSWALAILVRDQLVAARQRSPLLVRGWPGDAVLASDAVATTIGSGPLRLVGDGDILALGAEWQWRRNDGGTGIPDPIETPLYSADHEVDLVPGSDRMGVEIGQQATLLAGLLDTLVPDALSGRLRRNWQLPPARRVRFLACGSSFNAARVVAGVLAELADIEVEVVIASELVPGTRTPDITVAISQSGETADLLRALDYLSGPVVAITNVAWSSLARRADVVLDCGAGLEQGVAATKSFTAQIVAGIAFAAALAPAGQRVGALVRELHGLPDRFAAADAACRALMPGLAAPHRKSTGWLFLSTGVGLPYAAEGALKLKEISYRWAESYPVGELKHGPLALVEPGTPVVLVHNGNPARLAASTAEIQARGGRVLHVGGPNSLVPLGAEPEEPLPWGPLVATVVLQHLARELARQLGRDVDRPRNLAKSVTVT